MFVCVGHAMSHFQLSEFSNLSLYVPMFASHEITIVCNYYCFMSGYSSCFNS
jgi:hypothetical protein